MHRNRYQQSDVVDLGGLPVLAHDLALADYLCDGDKWSAFACLDQALNSSGSAAETLRSAVRARLERRDDPRGIPRAQWLTELATGKADSPPESFFRLIVVEAGLPIPQPQFPVRSIDGRLIYLLDMAWEQARVALEYDGFAAHEDRADYDAARDERMRLRGWVVVRATAADLKDPSRVLSELRAAISRARF
ncbi:MAG: endonuclease domain-containing protein [Thermocrispum sp.]